MNQRPQERVRRRSLLALPVYLAAFVTAGSCIVAFAVNQDSFGWLFMLGIPTTIGLHAGIYRYGKSALACVIPFCIAIGIAMCVMTADLAGAFCTAMAGLYLIPLMGTGVLVGTVWRQRLERPGPGTSVAMVLALLGGLAAEPRLTPAHEPETVATSMVVPLTPLEAWDAIAFYESLPGLPPPLFRLGMPRPVGLEGSPDAVGAIVRGLYETGSVERLVTERRVGERLAFEVIHQEGIEDRSAELLSGSFTLTPEPGGGTRVTIETTYRPKLQARAAWRPIEEAVCHELHHHLLDGLVSRAAQLERHAVAPDSTSPE